MENKSIKASLIEGITSYKIDIGGKYEKKEYFAIIHCSNNCDDDSVLSGGG